MKKRKLLFYCVSILLILSVVLTCVFGALASENTDSSDTTAHELVSTEGFITSKNTNKISNGLYEITIDAYATESVTTKALPTDVVLILDFSLSVSTSGFDDDLKDAVNDFIDGFSDHAKENNLDHQLAVVSFQHSIETAFFHYSEIEYGFTSVLNTSTSTLKNNIDYSFYGRTPTDEGFELAQECFESLPSSRESNKVAILFTDGCPTYSIISSNNENFNELVNFSTTIANKAIDIAHDLKQDGVTIYTIGLMDYADNTIPPESDSQINTFMHLLSSNYKNATSMNSDSSISSLTSPIDQETGQRKNYYVSLNNANASLLSDIFVDIIDDFQSVSEIIDDTAVLYDFVTPYFEIYDAYAYIYDYVGYNEDGERVFENPKYTSSLITISDNVVSVSGFDYVENAATDTVSGGTVEYSGKKLQLVIMIMTKQEFLGGNGVPTNFLGSGVYNADSSTCWSEFEVPTVDVALKTIQSITADEINVYDGQVYEPDELLNNIKAEFNDGSNDIDFNTGELLIDGVISFTVPETLLIAAYDNYKLGYYQTYGIEITDEEFAKVQPNIYNEVKESYNYGLEAWQNEFVDIEDVYLDQYAYSGVFGQWLSDSNYYFNYSMLGYYQPNGAIGINCSIVSKDGTLISNGEDTVAVNVFFPQVAYSDAYVKYGQSLFSFDPTAYFSGEDALWFSGSLEAQNVSVIGEKPTLIYFDSFGCEACGTDDDYFNSCSYNKIYKDTAITFALTSEEFGENSIFSNVTELTSLHIQCTEDEDKLPQDAKMWLHPDDYCELTIQKTGSSSNDTNQSYIFHIINQHDDYEYVGYEDIVNCNGWCYEWVYNSDGSCTIDESIDVVVDNNEYDIYGEYNDNFGYWALDKYGEVRIKEDRRCENDIDMNVVVHGNESVTIILPAGKYTIIEDEDWSWRYDAAKTSQTVTLSSDNPTQTVTFENSRTNSDGISGGTWTVNEFTTDGFVRKPEEEITE